MPTETITTDMSHPGDVVVPLSDVIDLLSTRLDQSELDDLLRQMLSKRTIEVQAGEIITAELMNQILADIANMQTRVAVLEAGIPSTSAPEIILVQPSGGVRINEELQVFGYNLSPDQLTSVTMGNRTVSVFSSASHSKLLVFNVPPILGIPEDGADVNLKVVNQYGSDSIEVLVKPSVSTQLDTTFFITSTSVPSTELVAETTYEYGFSITAYTSLDASYTLVPEIESADAGWSVQVKDGNTALDIPKSQPTPSTYDVVLEVTTGSTGTASLTLTIEADDYPEEWGESDVLTLELGEIATPNTEITFIKPPTVVPGMYYNAAADEVSVPAVPAGLNPRLIVTAELKTAGETYSISNPVVKDNTGGVWTATLLNESSVTTGDANELHQVRIEIDLADAAPITTPATTLSFSVERVGSSESPAVFTQKIKMNL